MSGGSWPSVTTVLGDPMFLVSQDTYGHAHKQTHIYTIKKTKTPNKVKALRQLREEGWEQAQCSACKREPEAPPPATHKTPLSHKHNKATTQISQTIKQRSLKAACTLPA